MAGSIIVRYAKKTYKQQRKEKQANEGGIFKNLNYSIDIVPESISIMTFENQSDAKAFAQRMQEQGNHIIEIKDDYKH